MSDHTRARCYEIPSWALAKYVKPVERPTREGARRLLTWAQQVDLGYLATVLGKRW